MDNLGLVPIEPNPFVNTGTPRSGQVWEACRVPGLYMIVLKFNKLNKEVTYRVSADYLNEHFRSQTFSLNLQSFLQASRFSH